MPWWVDASRCRREPSTANVRNAATLYRCASHPRASRTTRAFLPVISATAVGPPSLHETVAAGKGCGVQRTVADRWHRQLTSSSHLVQSPPQNATAFLLVDQFIQEIGRQLQG